MDEIAFQLLTMVSFKKEIKNTIDCIAHTFSWIIATTARFELNLSCRMLQIAFWNVTYSVSGIQFDIARQSSR